MALLIALGVLWVLRRRPSVPAPVPTPVPVPIGEPPALSPPPPVAVEEPAPSLPLDEPPTLSPLAPVAVEEPPPALVTRLDPELIRRFFIFTNPDHATIHASLGHGAGPTDQELASWVRIIRDFPEGALAVNFRHWLAAGGAVAPGPAAAPSPRVMFSTSTIIAYLEQIGFLTSQAAIDSVRAQLQPDSGNEQFQPGGSEYETLFSIRGVAVAQAGRHLLGSIKRRAA